MFCQFYNSQATLYSNLHVNKNLNKYFKINCYNIKSFKKLKDSVNFKTVRREFTHGTESK